MSAKGEYMFHSARIIDALQEGFKDLSAEDIAAILEDILSGYGMTLDIGKAQPQPDKIFQGEVWNLAHRLTESCKESIERCYP